MTASHRRRGSGAFRIAILPLALLLFPGQGSAQVGGPPRDTAEVRRMAEQHVGRDLTQSQILEQLRSSGLTRNQVQARLRQMGYDARLADTYFDALERGETQQGAAAPSADLVEALTRMGVQLRATQDTVTRADTLDSDSALAAAKRSRVFGKELFARVTTQFDPVLTGPVSGDYQLGPGDDVWLILTGDVEKSYPLTVTREGFLIIPQVGQVPVNSLTLNQLEDRLYTYLGRAYSGVTRGPNATTRFQVSLGQLRQNHVFVFGEVERPSGYQVSPLARVFNALYRAGGPNEVGSFRRVVVRRDGRQVAEVDLYPYLLAGDASSDVRLQQGDIVFVPVSGPRITVEGEVRRPGIFELRPGEGLRDALSFAGGVNPQAILRRVQIDRILPPSQRTPGKERTLVDVDVEAVVDREGAPIPLEDGDIVRVFSVAAERRNRVAVTGGVRKPGAYEWEPGMTLSELVDRASGLQEGAYLPRALVYRLQDDNTRRMLRAPLESPEARRLELADLDSVVVMLEDSLRLPRLVTIAGYVKNPGAYPLSDGMTLKDLVLAAGGFVEGAYMAEAEVARPGDPSARTDRTAYVNVVPLAERVRQGPDGNGNGAADGNEAGPAVTYIRDGVPVWRPAADEFELGRGDRVYIRRAPGYEPARVVHVTGEVVIPGEYEMGTRTTRISDIVARAGGLTGEAYAGGFHVVRKGTPVAGNLTRALEDPSSRENILLEPGDSLVVPSYDGTVQVSGAVLLESRVLFERGSSLEDYIEAAGGYAENAARDRVVVTHPSGQREVVDRFLFFKRRPNVEPGSAIFVPTQSGAELEGVDWDRLVSRSLTILTTLATLLIAADRISN